MRKVKSSDIESAIYAHIQAVRALGKTKIAPEEIARALDLPVSAVERSLSALNSKGVRVVHHG
jgi:DNA-binding IclR family transcriptional regulator